MVIFFRWLVNSNLFISLCAICMVWQTYLLIGQPITVNPLVTMVFCATLFTYTWQRALSSQQKQLYQSPNKHNWIKQNFWWPPLALILSVIGILVSVFNIGLHVVIILVIIGSISILYAIPIPGFGIRLRDIGILKPLLLGIVWAIATAMLPIADSKGLNFKLIDAFIIINRMLFISALALVFDIKDLEFDKQTMKFKSVPLLLGVTNTKYLAITLLVTIDLMLLVQGNWQITMPLTLSNLIALFIIWQCNKNKSEYYYTFWLDGCMVTQLLLVLIWLK